MSACSGDDATSETKGDVDPSDEIVFDGPVTYHSEIRRIMERSCVGCHVQNGPAPFPLTDAASAYTHRFAAVSAVTTRRMPPWQPDADCRSHVGSRRLSDRDVKAFEEWEAQGFEEGDESSYVPPEAAPELLPGAPSIETAPVEAYTPAKALNDDYRCLPLPQTFEEDTFIYGADIVPGVREMAHHALVYLVRPDQVAEMEALDAAEAAPGYTCFGGARVGTETVAGWVPGSVPMRFPEGSALVIPKGARLVLQMHYYTAGIAGDPPPDQSTLRLWTLDTPPAQRIRITPVPKLDIDIPAGDPEVVENFDVLIPQDIRLVGDAPHMHQLGASFEAEIDGAGGSEDVCLSKIPDWDFEWQQFYAYTEDAYVDVPGGSTLRVSCVYDNSEANQPVVDGVQQAPRNVSWGDGSLDEMCLYYAISMEAFDGDAGSCSSLSQCLKTCDNNVLQCALSCGVLYDDGGCAECAINQLPTCAKEPPGCAGPVGDLEACANANNCAFTDVNCLTQASCISFSSLEVLGCIDNAIEEGYCDDQFATCRVDS